MSSFTQLTRDFRLRLLIKSIPSILRFWGQRNASYVLRLEYEPAANKPRNISRTWPGTVSHILIWQDLIYLLLFYPCRTGYQTNSGYQSQAPSNEFFLFQKWVFGGCQSNVSMTILRFVFPPWLVEVYAKMSAYQRFLQDFTARSNTLDADSQDKILQKALERRNLRVNLYSTSHGGKRNLNIVMETFTKNSLAKDKKFVWGRVWLVTAVTG